MFFSHDSHEQSIRLDLAKLVILDRDGVINLAPRYPQKYILSLNELVLNLKSLSFISWLQKCGVEVCVATNQQCLGKGLLSSETLSQIHDHINSEVVKIGGKALKYYVCPHLVEDSCSCRKPNPGLLAQAMDDFSAEPSNTIFVGDQQSDRIAADRAGVRFLFVSQLI